MSTNSPSISHCPLPSDARRAFVKPIQPTCSITNPKFKSRATFHAILKVYMFRNTYGTILVTGWFSFIAIGLSCRCNSRGYRRSRRRRSCAGRARSLGCFAGFGLHEFLRWLEVLQRDALGRATGRPHHLGVSFALRLALVISTGRHERPGRMKQTACQVRTPFSIPWI